MKQSAKNLKWKEFDRKWGGLEKEYRRGLKMKLRWETVTDGKYGRAVQRNNLARSKVWMPTVSFDHEKRVSLLHFVAVGFLTVSSLSGGPFLFMRNGNLVPMPHGDREASASFFLPQGGRLEVPGRHPHLVPLEGAPLFHHEMLQFCRGCCRLRHPVALRTFLLIFSVLRVFIFNIHGCWALSGTFSAPTGRSHGLSPSSCWMLLIDFCVNLAFFR